MRIEVLEAELEGAKDGHREELEKATADLHQTQEVHLLEPLPFQNSKPCHCLLTASRMRGFVTQ